MPERIPPTLDHLSIPIDQPRPRKHNPRRGNIDTIAESLERNGQYRPIVVNKPTGEILAGNHTYAAAKRLGWTHIAATFVDVDEDQAARIVLADNHTADLGDYDETLLLDMLRDFEGDLAGTGYTQDDLDSLAALSADGVMDLDELADEIGDPLDEDTWPVLRFKVPPHVGAAWRVHIKPFDDEAAALADLLGVTPAPEVEPE